MSQEVITVSSSSSSSDEDEIQLPRAKRIRPTLVTDELLREILKKVDMDQETREDLAKSDLSTVCQNVIIVSESDEEKEEATKNEAPTRKTAPTPKSVQKPKTNEAAVVTGKSSKLIESPPRTFKAFRTTVIPKAAKVIKTNEIIIQAPKCFRPKAVLKTIESSEVIETTAPKTIDTAAKVIQAAKPVEPLKTVAGSESVVMGVLDSVESTKTIEVLPAPAPSPSPLLVVESKEDQEREKSLVNGNSKCSNTEEVLECTRTEAIDQKDDLKIFLAACTKSITGSKFGDLQLKYSILEKHYQQCQTKNNLEIDDELIELLKMNTAKAAKSPSDAVLAFHAVLELLKAKNSDIAVLPEHKRKVKLLLRTCKKLIRKIKQLEETEVDWDDDENSVYIQEDRYKTRLMKVFNLYCKYVKVNPKAGRIIYKKINFTASSYDEINAAISNKYRDNSVFPNYKDMEKLIRRTAAESELNLSDNKIKAESEMCFKKLGELLQKRRKNELYESHYHFIRDASNDPASDDPQLESSLKMSVAERVKKIEEICNHFVRKQTEGAEVEVSEDSDDSARGAEKSQSNSDSDSD